MVRLFIAKAQLFRKHWRAELVPFGVAMLKCWALTRMMALALASSVQPARRSAYHAWREVWKRRREFDLRQPAM
jgi:hypothetical protein